MKENINIQTENKPHPKYYVVKTEQGYISQGESAIHQGVHLARFFNFTDDITQAKKYRKLIKAKTDAGEFKPATILDENGELVLEMFKLSKHQKRILKRTNKALDAQSAKIPQSAHCVQ